MKMVWKRKVGGRSKFAERMSMQMMPMQTMVVRYNADYQSVFAQELNRPIWKRKSKLSRKKIRKLQCLLYVVDSPTLLSFTVALGRLIWSENLKAKRRKFEKKLSEKIKQRSVKKKQRRGKPGKLRATRRLNMEKKWKERAKIVTGFQMRPVLGSSFRMVVRRNVTRQHVKLGVGSLMYRLLMAMYFLSCRNVYVTSEWEFCAVCLVQEVSGFWGSIAFGKGLNDSLISFAKKFGINVVSSQHLERLESCFRCSSSRRIGCRIDA